MTIPQATQQVASHPTSNAVTAPTVKSDKDKDIQGKLASQSGSLSAPDTQVVAQRASRILAQRAARGDVE